MDVDLDLGNREDALKLINSTPASINRNGTAIRHATGVYVTDVPTNLLTGNCSLDHQVAEKLGFFKLDFLNMSVYQQVKSPYHLDGLLATPVDWLMLDKREMVEKLPHLNNHFDLMQRMPEKINSIEKLAMMLAIIRPSKRHLVGLPWSAVAKTVWDKSEDGEYVFKRSHSVAYSVMISVAMNLLSDEELARTTDENNGTSFATLGDEVTE